MRRAVKGIPRRVRYAIGIVLTLCVLWLGFSVGGALTAPGTDSTAARLAEWGRTHHLGWAVTDLEKLQYGLNEPAAGGKVAGGVPGVGSPPGAGATDVPSPGSHGPSGPRAIRVPAPLVPIAKTPLAREGQWQDLFGVKGHAAARAAFLRPDAVHTSFLAEVVWMDPSRLTFHLHPGYKVPGGVPQATNQIPSEQLGRILATFNSGFQMKDANGGYWQNGVATVPLRKGAASMVFSKTGRVDIESWPGGAPPPGTAAVRQNLSLLIDHSRVSPLVANASTGTWGRTVGNTAFVWRSALGVRADGSLVFALGPALNIESLAHLMQRAGAVTAMELDINRDWTTFLTYTHPTPHRAVPHKLTPNIHSSKNRYLQPSTRDFVAVAGR